MSNGFDIKEQVRDSSDIVAVVGSYLELRRQGRIYVARCPWHDDNRPSLQVNPDRQSWKCWVCDIGGDVFSFVMQREGVDFREALEMLAERAGIEVRRASAAPVQPGSPRDKKTLYAAMAWAEQQYHRFLLEAMEAEPAREYLAGRGISPESIRRFHVGYAPNQWQWLLDRAGKRFSPEVLQSVGLAGRSEKSGRAYDFFRGRVLFPIRDTQHRTVAFGGRILPRFADDKAVKYINTPETRLFSKSEQLYGLNIAAAAVTKERHILVMEGYTDVMMANQHGVENAVAVCGTALGPQHVKPRSLLRRHADRVTLVLDGDEAGRKRASEVLELFVAEQVDLRIATLPAGLDPCDFLQLQGPRAFSDLVAKAPDALEHSLSDALRGVDVEGDVHGASRALERVLQRIAKAPRLSSETKTAARLREGQMLRRLALRFRAEEEAIRDRLRELRAATRQPAAADTSLDARKPEQLAVDERELFQVFCLKPQLVAPALDEISPEHLQTSLAEQLWRTYHAVIVEGDYPDCRRVLTELEDSRLKNILGTLDWEAHERDPHSLQKPEERLASVIERMRRRQDRAALRSVLEGSANEEDALEIVKRTIEQQRQRMKRP